MNCGNILEYMTSKVTPEAIESIMAFENAKSMNVLLDSYIKTERDKLLKKDKEK